MWKYEDGAPNPEHQRENAEERDEMCGTQLLVLPGPAARDLVDESDDCGEESGGGDRDQKRGQGRDAGAIVEGDDAAYAGEKGGQIQQEVEPNLGEVHRSAEMDVLWAQGLS